MTEVAGFETGAYSRFRHIHAREPPGGGSSIPALRRTLGWARLRGGRQKARLPAHLEHDHLRRALRLLRRGDLDQMPLHLVSFLCM